MDSCPYCNEEIKEFLTEFWHNYKGPLAFKLKCPKCGEMMDVVTNCRPTFLTMREWK